MKYFCSYANTDEDITDVTARMQGVVDTLASNGHEVYCDLFDESLLEAQSTPKKDVRKIMKTDFERLTEYDTVLAIINSPRRSIGQLMELGAAYSRNIPIVLLVHESASGSYSYLPDLVYQHRVWKDDAELAKLTRELTTN